MVERSSSKNKNKQEAKSKKQRARRGEEQNHPIILSDRTSSRLFELFSQPAALVSALPPARLAGYDVVDSHIIYVYTSVREHVGDLKIAREECIRWRTYHIANLPVLQSHWTQFRVYDHRRKIKNGWRRGIERTSVFALSVVVPAFLLVFYDGSFF